MEAFKRELAKLLFKPVELQDPQKVSAIWIKNLNEVVNKMNNAKSLMIDMKPIHTIKSDTILVDKTYPEETVLPEDGLCRYLYQPGEKDGDQKRWETDFIGSIKYVSTRSNFTGTRQYHLVLFAGQARSSFFV